VRTAENRLWRFSVRRISFPGLGQRLVAQANRSPGGEGSLETLFQKLLAEGLGGELLAVGGRKRDHETRPLRERRELLGNAVAGSPFDPATATGAFKLPDACEEQAQVVVNFGGRADRRPCGARRTAPGHGDRRREPVDALCFGLFQPFEELPRVSRKAFDEAPLPFGVQRVEGEAGFAAAADAAKRDQPAARKVQIDPTQIVHAHAAEFDGRGRQRAHLSIQGTDESCMITAVSTGGQGDGSLIECSCRKSSASLVLAGRRTPRRSGARSITTSATTLAMPKRKPKNPFYVSLMVVGTLFALTACAYGVMTVRAGQVSELSAGDRFFDAYGMWLMAVELTLLTILTFAAIATDDYWTRRGQADDEPSDEGQQSNAV